MIKNKVDFIFDYLNNVYLFITQESDLYIYYICYDPQLLRSFI